MKQIAVGLFQVFEIVHQLPHTPRLDLFPVRLVKDVHKFLGVFNSRLECGFKVFTEHLSHLGFVGLIGPLLLFLVQALEIDGRAAHGAVLVSPLVVPLLDA